MGDSPPSKTVLTELTTLCVSFPARGASFNQRAERAIVNLDRGDAAA